MMVSGEDLPRLCALLYRRLRLYERMGRVQQGAEDAVRAPSLPSAPHRELALRHEVRMELPRGLSAEAGGEVHEADALHPRGRR